MIGLVIGVVWNVILFGTIFRVAHQPPDPSLDLLRCYAEPSTTYYDGEVGYRVPMPDDFKSVIHCWPKDGCFQVPNGAMCWRVGTVKHRR